MDKGHYNGDNFLTEILSSKVSIGCINVPIKNDQNIWESVLEGLPHRTLLNKEQNKAHLLFCKKFKIFHLTVNLQAPLTIYFFLNLPLMGWAASWHSFPNNIGWGKRRARLRKLTVTIYFSGTCFDYWIKKVLAATSGSARCWRAHFRGM